MPAWPWCTAPVPNGGPEKQVRTPRTIHPAVRILVMAIKAHITKNQAESGSARDDMNQHETGTQAAGQAGGGP